jgi:hypothetical protein
MLEFLRASGMASERKLRLFVAACARSLRLAFGDEQEKVADIHERYADGLATDFDVKRFLRAGLQLPLDVPLNPVWDSARLAAKTAADFTHLDTRDNTEEENASIAVLLRDLFGPLPFQPVTIDPSLLTWYGGSVVQLAKMIYDESKFGLMPALADALEQAGCHEQDILGHCRGLGPFAKGCWVVDFLLGKS